MKINLRNLVFLFLLLISLISMNHSQIKAHSESLPNNPIPVTLGTEYYGTFPNEIKYNITLDTRGVYLLNLTKNSSFQGWLGIFNSSYGVATVSSDSYQKLKILLEPDNYTIQLSSSNVGNFTFSITYVPTQPGDSKENSIEMTQGTVAGALPGPGLYDEIWYKYLVENKGIYNVSLQSNYTNGFTVHSNDSKLVNVYDSISPLNSVFLELEVGLYFISIYRLSNSGPFNLSISKNNLVLGDSITNPIILSNSTIPIALPGPGHFNSYWYSFSSLTNFTFNFNLTVLSGVNVTINLYNDQEILLESFSSNGTHFISTELSKGDYFIQIIPAEYKRSNISGNFTFLSIQIQTEDPNDSVSSSTESYSENYITTITDSADDSTTEQINSTDGPNFVILLGTITFIFVFRAIKKK